MIHPTLSNFDYQQLYEQYPLYQNPSDFTMFPQYQVAPSQINQESEQKQESTKINHTKKNKFNNSKQLLPKTKQLIQEPIEQDGEILYQMIQPQYSIIHFEYGSLLPKLQSHTLTEGHTTTSKQINKSTKSNKKQKKENTNTGHWSANEHSTYVNFLSQYESIMNSSMMKKTSKIFKQMSELIGTRTPSQCRSHHQKFNPFAIRGDNGKRLPRSQKIRSCRRKKILFSDVLYSNQLIDNQLMFDIQNYNNPMIYDYQINQNENFVVQTHIEYEDYLKLRQDHYDQLEY